MKISNFIIPLFSFICLTGFSLNPSIQENNKMPLLTHLDAKDLLFKVLQNFEKIETFKTTNYNFVRGNLFKQHQGSEIRIGISTLNIVFKKPRRMFIEIKDSKDSPNLNNTRFYFDGGKSVVIKIPGILGIFPFTFPVNKPELSNYRGYNAEQIDTVSLQERFNNKAAKVKFIGYSNVFGEEVFLLEITNIKMLDLKVTKEIIGVRKSDYIMLLHEMYEGNNLVYQDKFKDFTYNIPLTENDFKL